MCSSDLDFYAQQRYDREHLLFQKHFVENISQPVIHDGKEHIDYVPTQILTEYFRHRYTGPDNLRIDGIIYPSAQRKRGSSVVIFAGPTDLDPVPSPWPGEKHTPLLMLDSASIRRLQRK